MLLCLVFILASGFAQESESGLTARQLYFKARPGSDAATQPTAARPAARPKPKPDTPAARAPAKPVAAAPAGGAAKTPAAAEQARNFGLRYAILQQGADRRMNDVDPEKEFASGETFALRLEANEDAWLYVYSAVNGELIFPGPNEPNQIRSGSPIVIPGRCAGGEADDCFKFDNNPGPERLMVILSATPEPNLDRLLRGTAAPSADNAPRLLASDLSRFNNQMRLEGRGVVRQTVRRAAGSDENAVYTVQTVSSKRPQVITEILLRHK